MFTKISLKSFIKPSIWEKGIINKKIHYLNLYCSATSIECKSVKKVNRYLGTLWKNNSLLPIVFQFLFTHLKIIRTCSRFIELLRQSNKEKCMGRFVCDLVQTNNTPLTTTKPSQLAYSGRHIITYHWCFVSHLIALTLLTHWWTVMPSDVKAVKNDTTERLSTSQFQLVLIHYALRRLIFHIIIR